MADPVHSDQRMRASRSCVLRRDGDVLRPGVETLGWGYSGSQL